MNNNSLFQQTIDINDIYIRDDKNKDQKFTKIIKKLINNKFKSNKISEEEYRQLGGNRDNNTKAITKNFYSDKVYVYPLDTVCNHCAHQEIPKKHTRNLPGIECYLSETSKKNAYSIKVKCCECKNIKNTFINKNTLPDYMLENVN